MTKLLLAFSLWCIAFFLAIVGLITTGPGNPRFTGTVVLDFKPFCQNFVVQTEQGFVLLEWEDGTLFFGEGDGTVKLMPNGQSWRGRSRQVSPSSYTRATPVASRQVAKACSRAAR